MMEIMMITIRFSDEFTRSSSTAAAETCVAVKRYALRCEKEVACGDVDEDARCPLRHLVADGANNRRPSSISHNLLSAGVSDHVSVGDHTCQRGVPPATTFLDEL